MTNPYEGPPPEPEDEEGPPEDVVDERGRPLPPGRSIEEALEEADRT